MRIESWQYDLVFFFFAILMLMEGRKIYGRQGASIFLWGSLLWTGIIENVNTMLGAYDYFAYANYYSFGGKLIQGYGGWISWIVFVPSPCFGPTSPFPFWGSLRRPRMFFTGSWWRRPFGSP